MRIIRATILSVVIAAALSFLPARSDALSCVRIQKAPALTYSKFSPAEVAALQGFGVTVLDDYGPFAMGLATDTADLAKAGAAVKSIIGPEPDAYRVDAGTARIDVRAPEQATANVPADLTLDDYPGQVGLYLVKFRGPVLPSWREGLTAADVRIIQYVHKDAYIVAASGGIRRLKALVGGPLVFVGVFQPFFKLAPGLTTSSALGATASQKLRISLDPHQDLAAITRQLTAVDSHADVHANPHTAVALVTAPPASWRSLARDAGVLAIEPDTTAEVSDERIDQIISARRDSTGVPTQPTTYKSWLGTLCNTQCGNLSAHIVDVMDSGIAANDDGVGQYHPDLPQSRIVTPRLYNGTIYLNDRRFHGTVVSGLIGGDPSLVGGAGRTDTQGFYYDMGVAPTVKIHPSRVMGNIGSFTVSPALVDQVVGIAYTDGARIQNSSWNETGVYGYTSTAQEYDVLVRNPRLTPDEYPDFLANPDEQMLVVFSAGNNFENISPRGVYAPATAKNIIAVGATALQRGASYGGTLGGTCDTTHRIWDIAEFSRQGVEGNFSRFKPDLYAPGQNVTSARSPSIGQYGDGSSYSQCAGTWNLYVPSPDGPNYPANGTSFSAPIVTGAAVLAKQKIAADKGWTNPSPALIKATLLGTTESNTLNGGYNYYQGFYNGWEPNRYSGFGRVALTSLLEDPVAKEYIDEDHGASPTDRFVQAGAYKNYTFTVADPSKAISAVLVYSDAKAAINATSVRVNEIDMYVLQGGYVYCDGQYGQQYATRSTGCWLPDMENNVKRARIAPYSFTGQFTIQIVGGNVSAHAVPGRDSGNANQDWALYVYNAIRN